MGGSKKHKEHKHKRRHRSASRSRSRSPIKEKRRRDDHYPEEDRYERERERDRYDYPSADTRYGRDEERYGGYNRYRDRREEVDRYSYDHYSRSERYRAEERYREDAPGRDDDRRGGEMESEDTAPKSSGGDISLSIEETNRLRAKLGLKPLDVPSAQPGGVKPEGADSDDEPPPPRKDEDDVHKPAVNLGAIKKTQLLKEKLQIMKDQRRYKDNLGKVKTLGDSSDSDDNGAQSWVKKSRILETEKKKAAQRAKMLAEMDEEFGVSDLIDEEFKPDKTKQYESRHLKGLKVEHDQQEFSEGKTIILTLKDKEVLDEDATETLLNVNMLDDAKAKKNIEKKKKKPDYQAFDEPEYDEYGTFKAKELLNKYDEEIEGVKSESFTLGAGGKYNAKAEMEMERIRRSLRDQSQTLESVPHKVASEFYTEDEMSKFKKVKKKVRKIRKKDVLKADDLLKMAEPSSTQSDLGSRRNRRRGGDEEMEVVIPEPEPGVSIPGLDGIITPSVIRGRDDDDDDDYLMNPADEDLANVELEEETARRELQHALNKARKLKQKKDVARPEQIAEKIIDVKVKKEIVDYDEDEKGANIILNATSEFCRTLGDIPTYGLAGNREEERDELMDFELELMQERKRKQEEDLQHSGWAQVKIEDQPVNIKEEEQTVLEEEPVVNVGIGGALSLAGKKGYLDDENKKKGASSKNSDVLASQNYSIEDKRYDDLDDKYRKRDRYCASNLMEFKEKSHYKPEVKLEYADETGRHLNPKEAFKQLSYRFHGKGSGKKKTEKLMKKLDEAKLMKQMSSTDTPLGTVALLQDKQKHEKTPYLVLSGGSRSLTSMNSLTK